MEKREAGSAFAGPASRHVATTSARQRETHVQYNPSHAPWQYLHWLFLTLSFFFETFMGGTSCGQGSEGDFLRK